MAGSYLSFLDTAAALAVSPRRVALPTERLILPPVRPPGSSHVTLWLHNPTSDTVPSVEVTVTALSTVEGDGAPVEAISVSPSVVSLPPGTRRSLLVRVDVAADQPAGFYHGWAVASVAPDEPLPLHLRVENGEGVT
jgi:P pilus assembly chaperone PapD